MIMRKIVFNILIICFFSCSLKAITVSKVEALQRALTFLSCTDKNAIVDTFSFFGKAEMYKVITNKGWVLLSSEKSIKPILAYSLTDPFPHLEDMPDGMKWLFSYYEDANAYAQQHAHELYHINKWEEDQEQINSTRETVYLSRLGDIKWGQSQNNDNYSSCEIIYNKFCPNFHSVWCNRTIVGCGSVALGQLLWYYQWPHWGLIPEEMLNDGGQVSNEDLYKFYDWTLMPTGIYSSTSILEVEEIAAFLRDCGYAEHMEYGSTGSNTYINRIKDALIDSFGYLTVQQKSRSSYTGNWVNLMQNEIRNGRPVIYRGGNSDSGHFFILHGFSGEHFNINWGWRGNFNATMYTLDSLYANGTHYNDGHYALTNIQPNYPFYLSCSPITIESSVIWDDLFLVQNGGGISVGNRTITSGMHGGILSEEFVKLTNGFKVNAGATVYVAVRNLHCCNREEVHGPDINENAEAQRTPKRHETTNEESATQKVLRDGQLLILRDGKTYTVTGMEIE